MTKRISFFTKIYFILISISIMVLIYKIDSINSRRDMNYILECARFNEIELDRIETNGIIEDKIYTWLNTNNPKLWERNKDARESLVNILVKEYGASLNEINRIKGYSNDESYYSPKKHNFNLIGIDAAYIHELTRFHDQKGEYATVEECLFKIKLLSKPFGSVVIKNMPDNKLRRSIDSVFINPNTHTRFVSQHKNDSLLKFRRLKTFDRIRKIEKINFEEGKFLINCRSGAVNAQHGGTEVPNVPITGITEEIEIKSFNTLLNYNSNYVDEIQDNPKLFNRLQNTYGKLYVEDCIRLLSEENSKSFKSIFRGQ